MRRRTKIVCTLGPASSSPEAIRALVDAGMDVARLNFSHGSRDEHATACARVREASNATGRSVAVLIDLQGPKIRLGRFQGGAAVLEPGSVFVVSSEVMEGTRERASVTYEHVARDLSPGDTVLIDDGSVKLRAVESDGREVSCQVLEGGPLSDSKGVNLPGTRLTASALTEKDVDDLRFALDMGVDVVALSFVRSADDVAVVRRVMDEAGRRVPVIAKLERPEAIDELGSVLDAFDGVMVARGDLGVELPLEQVPKVQKRAVQEARERAKPVIVATQMLDSMIHNRRPTRAEVSDVANAVLDGADALMLAGETGVGAHPVEAVSTMARIIAATEDDGLPRMPPVAGPAVTQRAAIAAAAVRVAGVLGARALVAFTQTGETARSLARHRSTIPVLAFTSDAAVRSQLALTWDVETFLLPTMGNIDQGLTQVNEVMLDRGAQAGDRVVVLAGQPGQAGSTHTVRIHDIRA
jgi:pyruvate kinase